MLQPAKLIIIFFFHLLLLVLYPYQSIFPPKNRTEQALSVRVMVLMLSQQTIGFIFGDQKINLNFS